MDKYLTGSRSQSSFRAPKSERATLGATTSSSAVRHHPYVRPGQVKEVSKLFETSHGSGSGDAKPKVSNRKLTLALLSSLKDEHNPITHSKSYFKTEHIVSGSSGHQVNDTGGRSSAYIKLRNARVESQALERVQDSSVTVFRGLVVYINGYCRGTTDTELKRLVVSGGGKISHSNHGGVTHIITSMQLSAKKTEQFKNGKPRKPTHIVTPEWIKDCYEQRKRLQEWKYNVVDLKNDTHVSG
ncbi:BRCA1 carboxy-terminus (BRCT) domain protein [Rhizoctonia solani 123E]|uniref:BRCA1 carboxy-terminus (BRCT) domain protein n=1 Tax=Rhizoctonia solani 123E TaxID=1423351 RepID=A0A074S6A6_9AGAM|nr:BRCA1 carboxy-terminus (BRCT) domain protein [Rhizoctonia solani 123E]